MAALVPSEEMATGLADTAARPEFLGAVHELRETPASSRGQVLQRVGHIDYMKDRGVSFPTGSRVCPRIFENPVEADDASSGDPPFSLERDAPAVRFNNGMGSVAYAGSLITVADTAQPAGPVEAERAPGSLESVRTAIQGGLEEVRAFVAREPFQQLLKEMYELDEQDRPRFVSDVIMDSRAREQRGIAVPDDMTIQRSAFADGRPTLFCISKLVPLAYPWRKVTITFDSTGSDSSG